MRELPAKEGGNLLVLYIDSCTTGSAVRGKQVVECIYKGTRVGEEKEEEEEEEDVRRAVTR